MRAPKRLAGRWRIVETDLWDADETGDDRIVVANDGGGELHLVAISATIDCRFEKDRVEFTWMGFDEGDEVGGRAWGVVGKDGAMRGRIFIHQGDDSGFVARRAKK